MLNIKEAINRLTEERQKLNLGLLKEGEEDYIVCHDGIVILQVENGKLKVNVLVGKPLIADDIVLGLLEEGDG
jgi:hypothetical protein